ncbi:atherin-like [Panicum virgatum]|uniref:Uncharacterized protein n=1 Tax=Panicum virgatum TaxID=38727 RepID=A0A8T0SGH0_PANVG|nr:atherin-like [Panicum virgatum]KAG2598482.1 hypothetical protein PVAP13_5KG346500 [Panicum virgatum]
MDVAHQLVHGSENKNVPEKARGKSTGEPQVRSGMPIFVPREERNARPRNSPGRPAFPASLAYPDRLCEPAHAAAVSMAAPGKEDWALRRGDSPGFQILVPRPRPEHDARPPGRPAIPSAVAAPPAYPGGPAQRPTPTTTPVASGVGASSKGATTDSEEEDQPPAGAVAKGEGEANAAAGHRSPPPGGAAGGNGGSAAPPAALENLPSVVARQAIPNTPAVDARPSPPAAARPPPSTSAARDNDRRKETTFCERLLSCFNRCS